jgi:hypothetical protein
MNPLAGLLGSRYDDALPYSYEAVVYPLGEDESVRVSYVADTICGLVNFLKKRREDPEGIRLFEIFRGKEVPIPENRYLSEDGRWLPRKRLCNPMTERYGEPMDETNCRFRDRKGTVCGPC